MHGGVGKIVAGKPLDPALARGERRGGPARRARTSPSRSRTSARSASRRSSRSTPSRPTRRPRSRRSARWRWPPARATRSSRRHFTDGGAGAEDLAAAVWDGGRARARRTSGSSIPTTRRSREKIETIADRDLRRRRRRHRCRPRRRRSKRSRTSGFGHLPVCMAKTQYSLSHDPTLKGRPTRLPRPDPRRPAVGRRGVRDAAAGRDADDARACRRGRAARTSTSTPTARRSVGPLVSPWGTARPHAGPEALLARRGRSRPRACDVASSRPRSLAPEEPGSAHAGAARSATGEATRCADQRTGDRARSATGDDPSTLSARARQRSEGGPARAEERGAKRRSRRPRNGSLERNCARRPRGAGSSTHGDREARRVRPTMPNVHITTSNGPRSFLVAVQIVAVAVA